MDQHSSDLWPRTDVLLPDSFLCDTYAVHDRIFCTGIYDGTGNNEGLMMFRPNNFGFSLGIVYLIWIAIVAGLYPLCKWYSKYKASHDHWWLSYL
jgi:hypothetical protein